MKSISLVPEGGKRVMDMTEQSICVQPVGVIRNSIKYPSLKANDSGISMQGEREDVRVGVRESYRMLSDIVINKDVEDILDGIEEYSHIVVLYWAHMIPEESRLLTKVHPMGSRDIPATGIFSTCSPARPNPVLATVVRLCGRKENILQVSGLDAVDGSPVIDIKPYVREFYLREDVSIPEWMQRLCREMA